MKDDQLLLPNEELQELGKKLEKMGMDLTFPTDNLQMNIKIPEMSQNELVSVADYFEKVEEYQDKSLEILQKINENTANLYTLIELISTSNDKQQDAMIEILAEILAIAKAKEKKEAESLLKRVISKIESTADTGEAIIKLLGWATTIYHMVVKRLP